MGQILFPGEAGFEHIFKWCIEIEKGSSISPDLSLFAGIEFVYLTDFTG
jgi:hypothetical protein